MTPCPVCRAETDSGSIVGRPVAFADIWAALEDQYDLVIPDELRRRYTPSRETQLLECGECGLRHFSPAIPGGPDFYELLDSRGYYNPVTWEGQQVAKSLRPEDDVVDFGCGDGAMLRSLPPRVGRTVGVDHSPAAIAHLRREGYEAFSDSFEDFARAHPEMFDVVSALQVLEHMSDADPLLASCVRVLRPGGRMLVAVPNSDRPVPAMEPLDHPPHHMSHWRDVDMQMLAERYDLEVVELSEEPPTRGALQLAVLEVIEKGLHLPKRSVISRAAVHALPSSLLRRAARAYPGRLCGMALLVEFRKPSAT